MDRLLRQSASYIALFGLSLLLTLFAPPARGEDGGEELALSLGLKAEESVATSRFPRPVSKIAENVTVITAREIARLNAHTLAEVLQTVPGIQLDQLQSPGSSVFFTVLGVTSRHILVQLDGVPLNFLSLENLSEVGSIPVQMIERVEIIKGAASAAWGSALGGVINVITKSPEREPGPAGLLSGSYGESASTDLRAELSGTEKRFGYYLTGGNIHADGLTPGNRTNLNHGFAKFTLELPREGKLTLGLDFRDNGMLLEHSEDFLRGINPVTGEEIRGVHGTGNGRYLNGYLALRYPLAQRLSLELTGRGGERRLANKLDFLTPPLAVRDNEVRERYRGAGLMLNWGDAEDNLSAGLDYERNEFRQRDQVRPSPLFNFDGSLERWAGYLNGTWTLGPLSILPGFRYDSYSDLENAVSYTLGATLRLTDSTVLRAYAARGYSMPVINNFEVTNGVRRLQNIETVQGGIESSALPYLWLKATLFYNNTWNLQTFEAAGIVLRGQVRQGIDLELRTSPLYGFALAGGYTYADGWDKQSKQELTATEVGPRQSAKLALNYDNASLGLRGALTGNWAHLHDPAHPPRDGAVIWDLHLTRKLFPGEELSPELFFSARNLFNGAQYLNVLHANPARWFELGARYRF